MAIVKKNKIHSVFLTGDVTRGTRGLQVSRLYFVSGGGRGLEVCNNVTDRITGLLYPGVGFVLAASDVRTMGSTSCIVAAVHMNRSRVETGSREVTLGRNILNRRAAKTDKLSFTVEDMPTLTRCYRLVGGFSGPGMGIFGFAGPTNMIDRALHSVKCSFACKVYSTPSKVLHAFTLVCNRDPGSVANRYCNLGRLSCFGDVGLGNERVVPRLVRGSRTCGGDSVHCFRGRLLESENYILGRCLCCFCCHRGTIRGVLGTSRAHNRRVQSVGGSVAARLSRVSVRGSFRGYLGVFDG